MWTTLSGTLLDVNRLNGAPEQLAASFYGNTGDLALDATTTGFKGPGSAPSEVHWRGDGSGWILIESGERIPAGDDDHDFFDLPKLLWPDRYPALAGICELGQATVILDSTAARLLGNGRAARVSAEIDQQFGVIRSYRSEDRSGITVRAVVLSYAGAR